MRKVTASITHVISENWHETAPKGARKKLQEIPLSNITLVYFPCNYYAIIFYSLTLFSAGFS
jgi:hypothetical protein